MTVRYQIQVDRDVCQGSGMCVGMAPEHFELADGYRSRPLVQTVDADDTLLDVAECCPTEAIKIIDADTGEVVA